MHSIFLWAVLNNLLSGNISDTEHELEAPIADDSPAFSVSSNNSIANPVKEFFAECSEASFVSDFEFDEMSNPSAEREEYDNIFDCSFEEALASFMFFFCFSSRIDLFVKYFEQV